jgi:hypothetical protein
MPLRHLWGSLNGLTKGLASAPVMIPCDLVKVPHSPKDQIPSGEGFERLFASAQRFGAQHFRFDRAGDAIDDLVLDLVGTPGLGLASPLGLASHLVRRK